jgi:rhodanese-related sulfurtransferase
MPHFPRSTALRGLAIAGLGGVAALISNGLSSPAQHLAWRGSVVTQPTATPRTEPTPPQEPTPPSPTDKLSRPSSLDHPAAPASRPGRSPAPTTPQDAVASNPLRDISGDEAWQAFQAGVSFLDARRSAEFAEGHIAGAWCTPVWESDLDDRLISFKAARRPGPEDPIVIYCSGGDCRDSHLLAAKLLNEGYFHLLIYRAGYPDWVTQGHPVEKGRP